jgi:hypothetical protein
VSARDVGDRVSPRFLVYNAAGALTNATVALTVTDPAGSTTTPSVTNTSTGVYDAEFTLASAGTWTWRWAASGTVVAVEDGSVLALTQAPPAYASLDALKSRVLPAGSTSTTHDVRLADALLEVSREIDDYCGRMFWTTTTATARLYYPDNLYCVDVDDFWTTTGLSVAVDAGNDGTYETTWASTDAQAEPLNGVVDGKPGWPYSKLRAVGSHTFPCSYRDARAPLQVTAKWGWPTVPDAVREACLILAEESFKLPDSPFGVGGYGPYGIVRVRENPVAARKLNPYRRYPLLVG